MSRSDYGIILSSSISKEIQGLQLSLLVQVRLLALFFFFPQKCVVFDVDGGHQRTFSYEVIFLIPEYLS